MSSLVDLLLLALAIPAVAISLYLLRFTLRSGTPAPALRSTRRLRFDVIVPAHDEAPGIAGVVANLLRLDWPAEAFRVLVVADNCSDDTAARARAAGAIVLQRHDAELRGKGHALQHAFAASLAENWAYAVVVVDADSEVEPNLLEAFAARIEAGAKAVQAHYGVRNPQASWRTRLLAIAMAAFHQVRSRGRERLRLSCGLRGNGWCVTHRLLRQVPYRAFSLAEDVEYGIELGLAGCRVHYADEARVAATMVAGEAASRSQRQRWEGGRRLLLRLRLLPLLKAGVKPEGAVCRDLALDLVVPPLSWAVLNVALLAALAGAATWWDLSFAPWFALGLACAAVLIAYVLRGWQLSGVGLRGLVDLLHVPGFVAWKLLLIWRRHGSAEWVRTEREKP